jgi:type I restriction enzyme M protein
MASIFDTLSRKESKHTVFNSLLDFSLTPYRYYPTGEALKEAHTKMQSWPDKKLIVQFMTELAEQEPEGLCDPLGEFYMKHISHGHLGQYFTPEPITDLMAQINMQKAIKAGQKVLDPACGSGRTLLSAAKIYRHLLFYGADLDPICCKMAVLNMLLNSLTGEIAHMNSLSNEFFRAYHCQIKLIEGHYYPYFIESTEPEQSYIWLHPQKKPPIPAND